ncbi:MAG TPA: CapA family protein [Geobacteraceae bacterium]|nr:CapA family protein [Geobacteraceae bacterium]
MSIIFLIAVVLYAGSSIAGGTVINAVGDIMLAGSGVPVYREKGFGYPFAATAAELRSGDITIGNLEAPIARGGREFTGKRFRFRIEPQAAPALRNAGFNIVTLANNHMMDFGASAMEGTLENLRRAGIAFTGAGETLAAARKAAIITIRGVRVAFLAYSLTFPREFYASSTAPGTAPGFPKYYRDDIAAARKAADYVVISFHWGSELKSDPAPYQITAAHRAIDAGADVVLGHHPHVLQGIEGYKRGIIFYSLGDFAFGSCSGSSRQGVIARITLENGVKGIELIPLNVLNREVRFQPKPLSGTRGEEVVDDLVRISRRWGTMIPVADGRFIVEQRIGGILAKR